MSERDVVLIVAVVMALGAAGTIVPVLPGLSLIWAAALAYGISQGFGAVGLGAFVTMSALAVGATVAGYVVPQRRASRSGASTSSVWLGVAGAVVGFFVVPVVGLALGGVLGIYVGEYLRTRDAGEAWRATRATLVGFGVAALIQFVTALAMIVVWVAWVVAA